MIDITKIQFASQFAGLGNNQTLASSHVIAPISMISGGTTSTRIAIPLERTDTLNRLQIQLGGIEDDVWHPITGQFLWYDNKVVASANQLFIINTSSDSNNNLIINVGRSNQTLGTITLSGFTLNVKVRVMRPPFV